MALNPHGWMGRKANALRQCTLAGGIATDATGRTSAMIAIVPAPSTCVIEASAVKPTSCRKHAGCLRQQREKAGNMRAASPFPLR